MSTTNLYQDTLSEGSSPTPISVQFSQAAVASSWANNTYGSQAGLLQLIAYDNGGSREGFRVTSSGSAAQIGFFGNSATQVTGGVKTAGGSYTSNEQTMLQTAYNALRSYGLLT